MIGQNDSSSEWILACSMIENGIGKSKLLNCFAHFAISGSRNYVLNRTDEGRLWGFGTIARADNLYAVSNSS